MFEAIQANQFQYRWGRFWKKADYEKSARNKRIKYQEFQYEAIAPKDARYNHIIQNLITDEKSYIIKTNWRLFIEQGDYIYARDNAWVVRRFIRLDDDISEQAQAMWNDNPSEWTAIELVDADEAE